MLIYMTFLWHDVLSSSLTTTQPLNCVYMKCTQDVAFVGILLGIVFDQYFMVENESNFPA